MKNTAGHLTLDEKTWDSLPKHLRRLFDKLPNPGSDEVVGLFPETKGQIGGNNDPNGSMGYHGGAKGRSCPGVSDSGSAARFFYCAKASKRDRNEGCEAISRKNLAGHNKWTDCDYRKGNGEVTANPQHNHHPTVKPTALMRYLIRLITPPGAVVLDPFMGSGSTGKAAILEGMEFIGIELEPKYFEIAKERIKAARRDLRKAVA